MGAINDLFINAHACFPRSPAMVAAARRRLQGPRPPRHMQHKGCTWPLGSRAPIHPGAACPCMALACAHLVLQYSPAATSTRASALRSSLRIGGCGPKEASGLPGR